MRLFSFLTVLTTIVIQLVNASRLTPPVLPLIVRNPYLSTWLPDARDLPWKKWPTFYTGQSVGLSVMASLPEDSTIFPLLGRPQDSLLDNDASYTVGSAIYNGAQYDASATNLTYILPLANSSAGKVEVILSFISPITPTSTVRQSIPAAYIAVYVSGNVDVNIYIDVNGQWVSGYREAKINWNMSHSSLDDDSRFLRTWEVKRETELLFTEYQDRSEWGTLHFSAPSEANYECGTSAVLRQRFARTHTLQNVIDSNFRSVMDQEPVFAFSKYFAANSSSSAGSSVLFTIAHIQDPVIQYAAARGMTFMRPLWESYFFTPEKLLTFHYLDFINASTLAHNYNVQLATDAYKSGADDYVDIVTLSARQVMGATSFAGTPEDPILFIKEISSDGNTQTVDVIFPAFPFFLYTNPRWLAYLLEPLIEYMLSGQYPNKYTMHDLGSNYPNATGHPLGKDEYMPVEECGNMLIMGLALANSLKDGGNISVASNWRPTSKTHRSDPIHDGTFPLTVGQENEILYLDEVWSGGPQSVKQAEKWVTRSYSLWKQWTGYLVDFSLRPHNQLSTDDFAGWLALQTNLALKGIIGIKAMAGLAELIGNNEDTKMYNNISKTYIAKWEEYGISRDKTHAKLAYDWYGSWTTTYNLYGDTLLCFHLGDKKQSTGQESHSDDQQVLNGIKGDYDGFVPKHIYQMQSDWYYSVRQKYGLPLDSRHLYTKTDWEFFAMAVAAPKVRAEILESVAQWVNETVTDRPLTDLHSTVEDGGFPGITFFARPVVGGHFAFLSLEKACGGHAMDGLKFLDDSITKKMDIQSILEQEKMEQIEEL